MLKNVSCNDASNSAIAVLSKATWSVEIEVWPLQLVRVIDVLPSRAEVENLLAEVDRRPFRQRPVKAELSEEHWGVDPNPIDIDDAISHDVLAST